MIPGHLIDKAIRALITAEGRDPDDPCEQWKFDSYAHDAYTVIAAVAADIWQDGYDAGWNDYLADDIYAPNPYRGSED